MSHLNNATTAYSAASKMVSSLRAVVMLYDGVLQALHKAKTAIEEGRIEDRFHATQKASSIILGLQANLDFDNGGDVAVMLDRFYHRCFRDIQRINMTNSAKTCESLIRAVTEVRDSWKVIAEEDDKGGKSGRPTETKTAAPAPEPQAAPQNPVTISV